MAVNLDDRASVTSLDPKGMLNLTEQFPLQCRQAYALAGQAALPTLSNRPNLVMLTGLGGSASGGDFARALFEAHGANPFLVNRDYHLPNFVGLGDVVFCASYSGNTEETLSAYDGAKKTGAKIIAVTSGGELAKRAQADGFSVIQVPGGQPPRTALGFMLIPVLVACVRLELLPSLPFETVFERLDRCAKSWTIEGDDRRPKELAQALHGAFGLFYGLGGWQSVVAYRWKCQVNENAKNLAYSNAYPELNHNEVLGWVKANEQGVSRFVVATLTDGDESPKMKARARVTQQLVGSKAEFHEVRASGASLLEKMLTLSFFGDFLTIYLAALNQIDPENIDSINVLKSELAKV